MNATGDLRMLSVVYSRTFLTLYRPVRGWFAPKRSRSMSGGWGGGIGFCSRANAKTPVLRGRFSRAPQVATHEDGSSSTLGDSARQRMTRLPAREPSRRASLGWLAAPLLSPAHDAIACTGASRRASLGCVADPPLRFCVLAHQRRVRRSQRRKKIHCDIECA